MSAQIILTATGGPLQGQQFTFTDKALCVVGRSRSCYLQVAENDYMVSRRHCLLDIEPPAVWVQDLGSLNGTYVNGALVGQRDKGLKAEEAIATAQQRWSLEDGDEIRVGFNTFRVHIGSTEDTERLEECECAVS